MILKEKMNEIIGIIVIVSIFVFLGILIYKQLDWNNSEKFDLIFKNEIKSILKKRKAVLIRIYSPTKSVIKRNSFSNRVHVSIGGTDIMAFEKVSYRIVKYKINQNEMEAWVRIVQSVFHKPKYVLDW